VNTREIHDAGDVVVAVGTYRGTAAKTSNEFESEFAHVWRFKDGKISGFRTYNDTHAWLKAIGEA
jgi:ketosteroid isomerase-like protein